MALRALILAAALAVCVPVKAASLRLAWNAQANAITFVVWAGPEGGDYTQAIITTNTTCVVSNLAVGQRYRFGLTVHGRDNGSETVELFASPYVAISRIEWSASPTGPWTAKGSNVIDAEPGFYRSVVEIR